MKTVTNILVTIGQGVLLGILAVVYISLVLLGASVGWVIVFTASSYSVKAGTLGALCSGGLVVWFLVHSLSAPVPQYKTRRHTRVLWPAFTLYRVARRQQYHDHR